jgi:hypothetical protein
VELVHDFGYGHKLGHRPEWLSAKIRVRSGQNDDAAARGKRSDYFNDSVIEKLGLINRDDLRRWIDLLSYLRGGIRRNCLDSSSVVTRHGINPGVARVEMRLENLNALFGDQ